MKSTEKHWYILFVGVLFTHCTYGCGVNCHNVLDMVNIYPNFSLLLKNVLFSFTEYDSNLGFQFYLINLLFISSKFYINLSKFSSKKPKQISLSLQLISSNTFARSPQHSQHLPLPIKKTDAVLTM